MTTFLIVSKRFNKTGLFLRTWDGIDQPDYTFLFSDINGRFSRYSFINTFPLIVKINPKDLENVVNWISETLTGKWWMSLEDSLFERYTLKFTFELEEDAALFKLSWYK